MKNHILLTIIHLFILWVTVSHLHPLTDTNSGPEGHDCLEDTHAKGGTENSNVAQQLKSTEWGSLPSDEQEECYRQQNIDPPLTLQKELSKSQKLAKGMSDLKPSLNRVERKVKENKPFGKIGDSTKTSAPEQSISLYSDLDQDYLKKKSSNSGSRGVCENKQLHETYAGSRTWTGNEFENNVHRSQLSENNQQHFIQGKRSVNTINQRVYKPATFGAEFPVYDEDLEFSADPLHGILNEKYWENQEDKGDVIRHYIELAANNMVPYDVEFAKRDVETGKCEIDESGGRCYCNQIVACKDCKKGRQEEMKEEETTTSEAKNDKQREKRSPSVNVAKTFMDESDPDRGYFNRKLLSLNDEDDDEGKINDNFPTYITSWKDNGHDEEMEDDTLRQKENLKTKSYRMKLFDYEKHRNENLKQELNSPYETFTRNKQRRHFKSSTKVHEYSDTLKSPEQYRYKNSTSLETPFLEIPLRNPNYYIPNNLVNIMQKPRQEGSTGVNADSKRNQQFESFKNQIFKNITSNTWMLKNNKVKRKPIQSPYFPKGRRSPEEMRPGSELSPIHSTSDQKCIDNKVNILNISVPIVLINATAALSTTAGTPIYDNTSTTTFTNTISKNQNDNQKNMTEEDEDAVIANDIVETIIMESQKREVLGLYRSNGSSVNSGRVIPETEKIISLIVNCILNKMKTQLAKQSCIILDAELLDFLKWLVLAGEPHKGYSQMDRKSTFEPKYPSMDKMDESPMDTATQCGPVEDATTPECEPRTNVDMDFEAKRISLPAT